MRVKSSARKRIRFELLTMCVLMLVLAALLLCRQVWSGTEEVSARDGQATAEPVIPPEPTPIPPDMFEWREGEYVHVERGEGTSNEIDESRFSNLSVKNAADLAAWAQMAWENQWGYLWGTFGDVLDEALLDYKIDQYGDDVLEYEDVVREKWMGRRVADCAGLIKGYGWYDPARHDIEYSYGDMPDMGTDSLYELAAEKGPIGTLPETPGVLVYAKGHVGVYMGGGWAVEAISHAGGVVRTRVADRTWTDWFECPTIQY